MNEGFVRLDSIDKSLRRPRIEDLDLFTHEDLRLLTKSLDIKPGRTKRSTVLRLVSDKRVVVRRVIEIGIVLEVP